MFSKSRIATAARFVLPICACILLATSVFARQEKPQSDWRSYEFPFHVLNVTSNENLLWICGTDESISVSSDSGAHWQLKHHTTDGGLLLNIEFANPKFGYAAGTRGLIFTTEDGGETWMSRSGITDSILQISFADPQHGLIRTPASVQFTSDGGVHWSEVSAEMDPDDKKSFRYAFSLVALDASHMAIMLKAGAAQYYHQAFLYTQDAGKSWRFQEIPDSIFYSFLRVGNRYWVVGTETQKDGPNGGRAMAAAFYSSDGEKWEHSTNDVAACQPGLCTLCTAQGCFSSNGVITRVFLDKTTYGRFPFNKELSAKWAATDSSMCFLGYRLECADLLDTSEAPVPASSSMPVAIGLGPLGVAAPQGPLCIVCALDRVLVAENASGDHTIKLVIEIAKNGTVLNVESQGAPTPDAKSRVEQQVRQWIFEPTIKNGAAVKVRLNTTVTVKIIKS